MTRQTLAALILVVGALLFVLPSWAQEAPADATPPAAASDPPMAVFEPYFGAWTIDATWAGGTPLQARQVFEPILDGQHVRVRTYVTTPEGDEYQRYEGTYSFDAAQNTYVYSSLAFDGTTETGRFVISADGMMLSRPLDPNDPAAGQLRQTTTLPDGDTFVWRVWTTDPSGRQQVLMDDAVWRRAGG